MLQGRCDPDDKARSRRAYHRLGFISSMQDSDSLQNSGASSVAGKQGIEGVVIRSFFSFFHIGSVYLSSYCASKFAVRGLTQSAGMCALCSKSGSGELINLAVELREHGITVNAYCPGLVPTPLCSSFAVATWGREYADVHLPGDDVNKSRAEHGNTLR